MSNVKWIGAAAGFLLGFGPIGAIIGYMIGKNISIGKMDRGKAFEISLLILSSIVIKADGKVLKSELEYVKRFFTNTFGVRKTNQYFKIFNELNKKDLDFTDSTLTVQKIEKLFPNPDKDLADAAENSGNIIFAQSFKPKTKAQAADSVKKRTEVMDR